MTFNWIIFLNQKNIEWVSSGPNTAKGNVSIRCPWCQDNDPSHHLGIDITNHQGWGCFRDTTHRGKRPHRLIQALLKCSYTDAQSIVGDETSFVPNDQSLLDAVTNLMSPPTINIRREPLQLPLEFRELRHDSNGIGNKCLSYLVSRGFCRDDLNPLLKTYQLFYSPTGIWSYRVIFPVYSADGNLAAWTGRAITKAVARYKTLTTDPDKAKGEGTPISLQPVSDLLWNYTSILEQPGQRLYVVEGPIDALWVDWHGQKRDVRATCLFSKNLSDAQIGLLSKLKTPEKYLLLDTDANMDAVKTISRLSFLGFKLKFLPAGVKDPAMLSQEQLRNL